MYQSGKPKEPTKKFFSWYRTCGCLHRILFEKQVSRGRFSISKASRTIGRSGEGRRDVLGKRLSQCGVSGGNKRLGGRINCRRLKTQRPREGSFFYQSLRSRYARSKGCVLGRKRLGWNYEDMGDYTALPRQGHGGRLFSSTLLGEHS